jgi:hypothetical protein
MPRDVRVRLGDHITLVIDRRGVKAAGSKPGRA